MAHGEVRDLLADAPAERVAALLAALLRARGVDARREGGSVVVDGPEGVEVLRPEVDDEGDGSGTGGDDIDDVDRGAATTVRRVGPAEVVELLLYGVQREEAAAIFEDVFDRPLGPVVEAGNGPALENTGPHAVDSGDGPGGRGPPPAGRDERDGGDPSRPGGGPAGAEREGGRLVDAVGGVIDGNRTGESSEREPRGADGGPSGGEGSPGDDEGRTTDRGEGPGDRRVASPLLVAVPVVAVLAVALAVLPLVGLPSGAPAGDSVAPTGTAVENGGTPPREDRRVTSTPPPLEVDPEDYPAAVGPDGITNPTLLGVEHARRVGDRSYLLVVTYAEYRGGRRTGYRRERIRVASPGIYRSEVVTVGRLRAEPTVVSRGDRYANGTVSYLRRQTPNGTVYAKWPTLMYRFGYLGNRMQRLISGITSGGVSHVVDAFERGNRTFLWVRFRGDTVSGNDSVAGSLLVAEDGLVHELRFRRRVAGHPSVTARVTVRYRRFGNVSVEPPPWLPAARNATATSPVGYKRGFTVGHPR